MRNIQLNIFGKEKFTLSSFVDIKNNLSEFIYQDSFTSKISRGNPPINDKDWDYVKVNGDIFKLPLKGDKIRNETVVHTCIKFTPDEHEPYLKINIYTSGYQQSY